MTGLNLESFLHLLRADLGAWATLGLIVGLLALMAWTSWGSRRALRKCLVLSVLAHCGLALYGGTMPVVLLSLQPDADRSDAEPRIRKIAVTPWTEPAREALEAGQAGLKRDGRSRSGLAAWDRPTGGLALADTKLDAPRPDLSREALLQRSAPPTLNAAAATPESTTPALPSPESREAPTPAPADGAPPPVAITPGTAEEIAAPVVERGSSGNGPSGGSSGSRLRPAGATVAMAGTATGRQRAPLAPSITGAPSLPAVAGATGGAAPLAERPRTESPTGSTDLAAANEAPVRTAPGGDEAAAPEVVKSPNVAPPPATVPEPDIRRRSRPGSTETLVENLDRRRPAIEDSAPLALNRVTPRGVPALPDIQGATGGRPLNDVPEVYRSRLDPNRSARAYGAGASPASEQAVERSLDWLARHQDTDGRWDAATAKYDDGTAVKGDDDFTVHCPPGEPCFGECIYWEADTALTGLALLAYLGAGYTQTDGKYAETVGKGLDYLLSVQKPDGDLRGRSRAVGMYCHAMATIALCEAYALTGEVRLRAPVERAVGFIARARARDGLAWRYAPDAPVGDTSILGWVVMALKSAREVGIEVPSNLQTGTLGWLSKVSSGTASGLGRYQPWDKVTPTMTAEAWVCRQFLGVGGPGAASSEAADYLLAHGPKVDPYNLYYWYYGTLAMYQHGGDAWTRWNAAVRDEIVRRQRLTGHATGSWDPDESPYGSKGGRIYCTALATLSLEVYYRYLRLYDEPRIPPAVAPAGTQPRALGRRDTTGASSPSPRASSAGPLR
ncbi:MAG: hypothetical protein U0794_21215 [Isosphaeraceae bacterium]